jgi:hypothetical protein
MFCDLNLAHFGFPFAVASILNGDDQVGVSLNSQSIKMIEEPEGKIFLDLICHDWEEQIMAGEYGPLLTSARMRAKGWLRVYDLIPDRRELFTEGVFPQAWLNDYADLMDRALAPIWENIDWYADFYAHAYRIAQMVISLDDYLVRINRDAVPMSMQKNDIFAGERHLGYRWDNSITGRLSTRPGAFPIHNLKKRYRGAIIPHNDAFLSIDFNAADLRSALLLTNPNDDFSDVDVYDMVCDWLRIREGDRAAMKQKVFVQLYAKHECDLQRVMGVRRLLESRTWTLPDGRTRILTPYNRVLTSREPLEDLVQAFPLMMQATTNDAMLEAATRVHEFILEHGLRSRICFLMHDEYVIDLAEEDADFIDLWIDWTKNTHHGKYAVNLKIGENYGDMQKFS